MCVPRYHIMMRHYKIENGIWIDLIKLMLIKIACINVKKSYFQFVGWHRVCKVSMFRPSKVTLTGRWGDRCGQRKGFWSLWFIGKIMVSRNLSTGTLGRKLKKDVICVTCHKLQMIEVWWVMSRSAVDPWYKYTMHLSLERWDFR